MSETILIYMIMKSTEYSLGFKLVLLALGLYCFWMAFTGSAIPYDYRQTLPYALAYGLLSVLVILFVANFSSGVLRVVAVCISLPPFLVVLDVVRRLVWIWSNN